MAKRKSLMSSEFPRSPTAAVAAPSAAGASGGVDPDSSDEEAQDLVDSYLSTFLAPTPEVAPALQAAAAWALGYMDDRSMGLLIFMMVLPVCASKAVEALGGKGAWAKKPAVSTPSADAASEKKPAASEKKPAASEKTTKPNHLAESLNLPLKVWIGPAFVLCTFRADDDLQFAATCVGVYLVMVAGQYVMKVTGLETYSKNRAKSTTEQAEKQPEKQSEKQSDKHGGGSTKKKR